MIIYKKIVVKYEVKIKKRKSYIKNNTYLKRAGWWINFVAGIITIITSLYWLICFIISLI